jgi:hypothetical protein
MFMDINYLEAKELLPTFGQLLLEARILEVVDRRSGIAVILAISVKHAGTGREDCFNEWTSFLLKMPGDGASKPSSLNTRPPIKLPDRKPDLAVNYQTKSEQGAH